eukprot:6529214-Prymnesium_polylepis.1
MCTGSRDCAPPLGRLRTSSGLPPRSERMISSSDATRAHEVVLGGCDSSTHAALSCSSGSGTGSRSPGWSSVYSDGCAGAAPRMLSSLRCSKRQEQPSRGSTELEVSQSDE